MATRPPEDKAPDLDNVVKVNFSRTSKVESVPQEAASASASDVQKVKILRDLLEQGVAMVILDARREGVIVPADFAGELDLRLNFSHRYGIKDFVYDERGLEATLSFAQGFYFCRIPWHAVFAIQSHASKSGAIWPEDVPPELQMQLKAVPTPVPVEVVSEPEQQDLPKTAKRKNPAPFLRLVTDE